MTYTFIEAAGFTQAIKTYFKSDDHYADFQSELALRPDSGRIITGAGPLRKIRWQDARRTAGKRGGLRVIYIHIPDLRILFLLDVYSKDDADDLTAADKRELQAMASQLVAELRHRKRQGTL